MKAVIPCGGKGTRLGSISAEIPKPMIRIGDKPVLEHQIELLKRYGIRDIIMLTGHLAEQIESYFKDGKRFGVNIEYYREQVPLGTTGGLKEIEKKLNSDFLLLYGDVMVNMNLKRLIEYHFTKNGIATLVVHPNDHPHDSDLLETDENGRIIAIHPKPHDPEKWYHNLVSAALYVLSPKILDYIEKGVKADFGKDIFPKIIDREPIYAYRTAEYLKDMGTPERLEQVRRDYSSGRIERLNIEKQRKAIFLDRDGVINEEVNLLHKIEDLKLIPEAAKAIAQINRSEYLAIVVTNQSVIARGLCTLKELDEIHKKLETLLGKEGAYLDAIYFCPHHPDRGYPEEVPEFKIECECRKPKIGMIKKAVEDFNIDLKNSFIIGDSKTDILTGINAGITTIGLMTGRGCRDSEVKPDYMFEDLNEAIDFIINEPYRKFAEEIIKKIDKKPFIIGVGGKSRSGKSTFSKYLKKLLEIEGRKVKIIELDDWLIPASERSADQNVYERFQLKRIEEEIQKVLAGDSIRIRPYNALSREKSEGEKEYFLSGEDVIIIEGVVALSSEFLRSKYDLRVFCKEEKGKFIKRVCNFYRWKGLSEGEIQRILDQRFKDEYPYIENEEVFADLVVER
ncbi:MAG: HAD-IIIA family hydrolase [Candidatus Woesearchaeota archaeon]